MPCRFGSCLNPDGSETRFLACSRPGTPPPCPFPADPGPSDGRGPSDTTPAAFRPGAPFLSARWGRGLVLGPAPGDAGRIAVRFVADGVVRTYDLATLRARSPLPFG